MTADDTINTSGPENRCPKVEWSPCAVSALIDGFIQDKWIAPDDKWLEVAHIYRGQANANWSKYLRLRDRIEAGSYADSWIYRWLEDTA